jgi:hypothetical protein
LQLREVAMDKELILRGSTEIPVMVLNRIKENNKLSIDFMDKITSTLK